jgi:hypothetical protein
MKNKNLRQIIKKTIVENLNKKSCDCGCGGCSDTVKKPQLSLNENQINKTLISEGLNWHLTHQKPLTEQLYRAGSEKYFSLWKEARHLYSRGLFESTFEEDIEILTETNLGEFGFLEDGTRVPLDFPMEEENLTESKTPTEKEIIDDILNELNNLQEININNIKEKLKLYAKKGLLTLSIILSVTNSLQANNPQLAQDVLKTSIEMVNSGEKVNFYSAVIGLTQNILSNAIEKGDTEFAGYLKEVKLHYENLRDGGKGNNLSQGAKTAEKTILKFLSKAGKEKTISFIEAGKNIKTKLNESKKENKPLNKPMRDSSGGKAYKVYVRDPKTKNIKTVRFGSGGLRAKINDPKARKAFAARHDCKNKKDRTKPSYWSCRLPRFANSLGLKGSFSGFW